MQLPNSLLIARSFLGVVAGVGCIIGALTLLLLSQDAMLVLIHQVGEERVLGSSNVHHHSNGSVSLTNPGAMAKLVLVIWGVGLSQLVAGAFLIWKSASREHSGLAQDGSSSQPQRGDRP